MSRNLEHVVGAAQPAPRYCGTSTVVSPYGDVVAQADGTETVLTATLDTAQVAAARRDNPSLTNRRL